MQDNPFNLIILSRCIFLSIWFLLSSFAQATILVNDDLGNQITLPHEATRIISLAPHITEIVFAAGAGDRLVGVETYSDYPKKAKSISRVGGYPSFDIEKIISLKPDLIIAWSSSNSRNQLEKLSQLGIPIYLSEPREILDIAKSLVNFGRLAGTSFIAEKAKQDFMQQYNALFSTNTKKSLNVFYQIWNKPLMTINGEHLISKVITLCGGKNIFSELGSLTPSVSVESVIQSNTEVIIAGGSIKEHSDWIDQWQHWSKIPAVKNNNIYLINADLIQRPGPRLLQGAKDFCDILETSRKKQSHVK